MALRPRLYSEPWTPAQDEELRRLVRGNTSTHDIAATLARTPEAVFQRAWQLGLTVRRAATVAR